VSHTSAILTSTENTDPVAIGIDLCQGLFHQTPTGEGRNTMKTMKRFGTLVYVVGLVASLVLLSTAVAFADGGSIVLTGAADIDWTNDAAFAFEAKTLAGSALNSTDDAGDSCVWGIVDGRGSGAGWKISVSSSDLTGLTNNASEAVTNTLTSSMTPAYNQFGLKMQVEQADATVKSGADGSSPVSGLTYNVSTADFVTGSAVEALKAATDQGLGGYDIDPLFSIYLPAGVYAGTASLTLTVTQADSPA